MADLPTAIGTLEFFNEKADRLVASRFIQSLLRDESGFRLSGGKDSPTIAERYGGPDLDDIEAFALNYRFFTVNNEATSLANMARLYASLPVDAALVRRFNETRAAINQVLDTVPPMSVGFFGAAPPSNREIVKTFLYGGLAHGNDPAARAQFVQWRSIPIVFPLMESIFVHALATVARGLADLRAINTEAVAELHHAAGESTSRNGKTAD